MRFAALLTLAMLSLSSSVQGAEQIRLLAAGSLKAAMTDIGKAFSAATGTAVENSFGASGLLRERIFSALCIPHMERALRSKPPPSM